MANTVGVSHRLPCVRCACYAACRVGLVHARIPHPMTPHQTDKAMVGTRRCLFLAVTCASMPMPIVLYAPLPTALQPKHLYTYLNNEVPRVDGDDLFCFFRLLLPAVRLRIFVFLPAPMALCTRACVPANLPCGPARVPTHGVQKRTHTGAACMPSGGAKLHLSNHVWPRCGCCWPAAAAVRPPIHMRAQLASTLAVSSHHCTAAATCTPDRKPALGPCPTLPGRLCAAPTAA